MSEDDRRRWDQRHSEAGIAEVDPGLPRAFVSIEDSLPVRGHALEIACGRGEMAVWLAKRGMEVQAVDVSPVAVEMGTDLAVRTGVSDRCRFEVWDLNDGMPPGPLMDLVVCHMYRESRLDQELIDRLAVGGLLAIASLSEVGGGPGRFRARPGELRDAFGDLESVDEDEGEGVAWLLGRKPG